MTQREELSFAEQWNTKRHELCRTIEYLSLDDARLVLLNLLNMDNIEHLAPALMGSLSGVAQRREDQRQKQ